MDKAINRRALLKGLAGVAATTAFEGVASAAPREDELEPPNSEMEALNGEQIRERLMRVRDLYLETKTAVDPREIFRVLRRLPFLAGEELPFFQVSDHITDAEKNANISFDVTKPPVRKDLLKENFQRAQEAGELKLSNDLSLVAVGDFSYASIPGAIAFYDPTKRAIVFNQEKDRAAKERAFNDKLWPKMTNALYQRDWDQMDAEETQRLREDFSADAAFQAGLQRFLEDAQLKPWYSQKWAEMKPMLVEEYYRDAVRKGSRVNLGVLADQYAHEESLKPMALEEMPAQMLMEVYEQQMKSLRNEAPPGVMEGLQFGGDIISEMEDFVRSEIKHERFTRFSITHEAFHYFVDQYIVQREKSGYEGPAMEQLLFEAIDNTMRRVSLAYPEYDIDAGRRYGEAISGGQRVFDALREKKLTDPESLSTFVADLAQGVQAIDYRAVLQMQEDDVDAQERERLLLIIDATRFLNEYFARVYAGALGATPERLAHEMNSGLEAAGLLDQRSTTDQFSVPMMQPTEHELELIRSMKVNGQSILPKMK